MQQIGGQMRVVVTPQGHVPHKNSTIIRDFTEGKTIRRWYRDPKSIISYCELMQNTARPLSQLSFVVEIIKTSRSVNLHTPNCTIEIAG
jgi:hypothetical protein